MTESVYDDKPQVVVPLLVLAVLANLFLFTVSFTNASFNGAERALPDPFAPAHISQNFDRAMTSIAENVSWSVSTVVAEVKPQIVAFLGMDDYKYGMPRYTALSANAVNSQSQVLGASITNPEYSSDGLMSIPTPQLIEFQFKW